MIYMAGNSYKIQLGVDLKVNDIRDRIKQYNSNTNNAKLKLGVKLDVDDIKKQISKLNLSGTNGGKGVSIPVNTQSLETSLKEVKGIIADIKTSIGSLDSGAGMKSLLSSVNQISVALDKTSGQFAELNTQLSTLASKDFNINFGIKLGGGSSPSNSAAYGDYVRQELYPELRRQEQAITKYLAQYYNTNEISAVDKLYQNSGRTGGFQNIWAMLDQLESPIKKSDVLGDRISQFRNFFRDINEMAKMQGIDLSPVMSQFDKLPDELIKRANDIKNGTSQVKNNVEELKNVFGSGIDAEKLSKQLDSIVVDLGEIKTELQGLSSGVPLEGLTTSFDKLSDTLEKMIANAKLVQGAIDSVGVDSGMSNQVKQAQDAAHAYREVANEARKLDNISIDISDGNIDDLKNALRNLNLDDASIENITKELNELNIVAKSVSGTFKDGNLVRFDIKGLQTVSDGLERVATITKTFGVEGPMSSEKYSQALDKIAVAAEKVNKKLKSGSKGNTKFDVEIGDVEKKFNNLSNRSAELRSKIEALKQEFTNIQTASAKGDIDGLVAANERYERALRDVNNQLKLNKQAEQQVNNNDSLTLGKENAMLRLKGLFSDNSEAARKFGAELNKIQKELDECGDTAGLKRINAEITNLGAKVKEAGAKTQTFGDKLKKQFSQYSSYFSVASLFMYAEQGLRSMFEQVKLIDSAMTELKKVTDETDATYKEFLTNAATSAREIGTTIDGLISSTADFARLGYGFEDAQGLAEVANIYAVVGDEIEGVEGATESLISTMAAFKGEMNGMSNTDFAMSVIDKFNEIGNNFAISSGGIGEALERSASSLMAANNTIDESIALITAANTVVQDPAQVGKVMPTLKVAISVKLLRRTRPRKDFISIFGIHQLGRMYVFLINIKEVILYQQKVN